MFKRFSARYAVVGILVLGLVFLLAQGRVDLSGLSLKLAAPVFTMPAFSLNALLSVALPLFLITLTGQYMPGMLVLRNDGFKTSANPIVTITGLGSLLMAPFGSHAFNIAAITAAICTGREAHEDPSKRWIAGMAAGVFYVLIGVFGVTLAAVFMAFPATFITTLAGLALLGTIGGSLATAMSDAKTREASLITFLAAAANITLLGIGGAFWGLVLGLAAHAVLNGQVLLRDAARALSGIGGKCRNVDQRLHIGMVACLADDCAAIRVAHEHHRAIDLRNHLACSSRIIGKGGQWVFHCADVRVTTPAQFEYHLGPMGGTAPETVNQNDGGLVRHRGLSGLNDDR